MRSIFYIHSPCYNLTPLKAYQGKYVTMMQLKKYGIVLKKLEPNDLELVRKWRNHPSIQKHMIYREYITEEMQIKWYKSIDNNKNYYFTIHVNSTSVGLTHIKNIDFLKKTAEFGIFLWDPRYREKKIASRAVLIINDFVFETLNLERLNIQILSNNIISQQFFIRAGYCLMNSSQQNSNMQIFTYYLTKEKHNQKTDLFREEFLLKPVEICL